MNDSSIEPLNLPSAQLILSVTPTVASITVPNLLKGEYFFNNIDMMKVLGRMYDEYDYFNITLQYGLWSVTSTFTYTPSRIFTVDMKGLNWIANSQNASATLGYFKMSTNNNITTAFRNNVVGCAFRKQPNVNLSIQLNRVDNGQVLTASLGNPPGCQFVFTITPIIF